MDLAAKLPQMADAALVVLRENAERLEQTGTSAQKAAAAALMPALEAELESRRAAKLAAAKTRRTATKRRRQRKPERRTTSRSSPTPRLHPFLSPARRGHRLTRELARLSNAQPPLGSSAGCSGGERRGAGASRVAQSSGAGVAPWRVRSRANSPAAKPPAPDRSAEATAPLPLSAPSRRAQAGGGPSADAPRLDVDGQL